VVSGIDVMRIAKQAGVRQIAEKAKESRAAPHDCPAERNAVPGTSELRHDLLLSPDQGSQNQQPAKRKATTTFIQLLSQAHPHQLHEVLLCTSFHPCRHSGVRPLSSSEES